MGPLGTEELVAIFVLALLLFGPKELPKLGKTIGKALSEFRRAQSELKSTFDREMKNIEREANLKELRELTSTAFEANSYNYDNTSYDSTYYEAGYDGGVAAEPANGTPVEHSAEPAAQPRIEAAPGSIPAVEHNGHIDYSVASSSSASAPPAADEHGHSSGVQAAD